MVKFLRMDSGEFMKKLGFIFWLNLQHFIIAFKRSLVLVVFVVF